MPDKADRSSSGSRRSCPWCRPSSPSRSCRSAATSATATAAWSTIFGHNTYPQLADPPVGMLLVLAMSSIAVYGMMLAGWSSGSKYPLLGSVRASGPDDLLRSGPRPVVARPWCCVAGTLITNGIVARPGALGLEPLGHRPRPVRDLPASPPPPSSTGRRSTWSRPSRSWSAASRPSTRLPIRHLLPGRVPQHRHHVGHHRDPLPGRSQRAGARSAPGWLVGHRSGSSSS